MVKKLLLLVVLTGSLSLQAEENSINPAAEFLNCENIKEVCECTNSHFKIAKSITNDPSIQMEIRRMFFHRCLDTYLTIEEIEKLEQKLKESQQEEAEDASALQ